MKLKQIQRFSSIFALSTLFCISVAYISQAQSTNGSPVIQNIPFYQTSDFWGKVTLAILTASLGALTGYLSSEKRRRDESVELSYAIEQISVLEFKKDIREKITIKYGNGTGYEVSDLYIVSCDVENTGRRVIKNEDITFELSHSNVGILDQFFEPPLGDNSIGVEELRIDDLKEGEIKKKYLIRNILFGQKVGFRFITARLSQQDPVPALFISNKPDSKVQLVPKSYKRENDENYRVTRFITLFLLFIILPPVFSLVPFYGSFVSGLARLIIFVLIFPYIGIFSERASSLLGLLLRKLREQSGVGDVITQTIYGNSNQIIGEVSGGIIDLESRHGLSNTEDKS